MRTLLFFGILLSLFFSSCSKGSQDRSEPWVNENASEWPAFSLTNKITFGDTSYTALGNAFLVDTGNDTLGVSCKHIFTVFSNYQGYQSVCLDESFKSWKAYPKNQPDNSVEFSLLINQNKDEQIGQFNTLKDRDWLIFKTNGAGQCLYPLKIRYTPLLKGEVVYAYGWCTMADDTCKKVLSKMQVFKSMGNYYYVETLKSNGSAKGTSGSAVIDKNGHLVGIVSGAEGRLGVIGSIAYLETLFRKYQIPYVKKS